MTTLRTPYETLKKLHSARNVGAIDRLFQRFPQAFNDLAEGQGTIVAAIKADLEAWRTIENIHGTGAVMNLHDPAIERLYRLRRYLLIIPQECFDNAFNYQGARL